MKPHAQLLDADGQVVGGAGLRDGEWVLVLGAKAITTTSSAAMVLAMLKHTIATRAQAGLELRLQVSSALDAAATHEAMSVGKSLPQYLEWLEEERSQRRTGPDETAATATAARH